ncbi:MAG: sodium-dependent transporter [Bacteroidetes bacterium]|nr:sodium-dependent transporter [Bacteroidota bacterium]
MKETLFSSRIAAILTLLGVAIGLGNVWRFPYMMGRYGGSAFLIIYLVLTLLFAFPALIAEMTLGRMSRKGTIHSLQAGFGPVAGKWTGYFLLCVVTIAGSYYAVVVSNVFFTSFFALVPGFNHDNDSTYTSLLANGWLQYAITLGLIVLSLLLIWLGLIAGIERVSKRFMPVFFVALIYMIVHALTLPGAVDKFVQFLQPDFHLLGPREMFAALGQAFFSVGLGGTFVVVYAGFLGPREKIPGIALYTAFGDASASLLFSLFLIPSMLVFGLDMTEGPRLIFHTFPQLFAAIPGGRFVGPLFLLSISIVAFLSLVAAYEVPFMSLSHQWPQTGRTKLLIMIGTVQAILALPSAVFPSVIGYLDLIFGSGMQVLGSALCVFCLTWGMRREQVLEHMFNGQPPAWPHRVIFFWIRWIIPLALLSVLGSYVYEVI